MSTEKATEKASPEKKRKSRRWLKITAAVAVLLMIVVIMLPYILPKTWLASAVAGALRQNVNRPVELGGVSWGWLGGVQIDNVVIGESQRFGGGTFLKADGIELHVSFLDLIRKKVTIKSVAIKSPRVSIVRSQEGAWNFDDLLAKKTAGQPVAYAAAAPAPAGGSTEFSIQKVNVDGGDILFEDRKQNVTLRAKDVTAAVDADFLPDAITGDAQVKFDIEQGGAPAGRFELAAADARVPKTAAPGQMQGAKMTGRLTLTGIEIAEAIAAAMPEYGRELASGRLTIALDYAVDGNDITVKANKGQVAGLVLGKQAIAKGPARIGDVGISVDATIKQDGQSKSVNLRTLELETPFSTVSASGQALIAGEKRDINIKASGTVLPSGIPAALVALPPDLKTTGALRFTAAAQGAGEPMQFSASVDAESMDARYGTVLAKRAGLAARVAVQGKMQGREVTVDSIETTLAGATVKGTAAYNLDTTATAWQIDAAFDGFNAGNYYPGSKGLVAGGGVRSTGRYTEGAGNRPEQYVLNVEFQNLTLDATEHAGVEAGVTGGLVINTERAEAKNLTVNVGGRPITITAAVEKPLEVPTGRVEARGEEINVDDALAVVAALQSAVAPAEAAPGQPQEKTPQAPPAPQTPTEGPTLMEKANIAFNLVVNNIVYQGYQGNNLVVDATLRNGTLDVRQASAQIFGGQVDLKTTYNLAGARAPFNMSLDVARVQAAQPAADYLKSYMPGLGFDGTADLSLSTKGETGAGQSLLNTLTGNGRLDITNGSVALAGLPQALGALININTERLRFDRLQIPIQIADGAIAYRYGVPVGGETVVIAGKKFLAGGYTQDVGYMPRGAQTSVHLFTLKDGAVSFVRPERLMADLARLRLGGVLQQPAQPGAAGAAGRRHGAGGHADTGRDASAARRDGGEVAGGESHRGRRRNTGGYNTTAARERAEEEGRGEREEAAERAVGAPDIGCWRL